MPKLESSQVKGGPPPAELVRPEGNRTHVSYSELSTFRDCPLKWQLKYYWRLMTPTTAERLDGGTVWHLGMDTHYTSVRQGLSRLETLTLVFNEFADGVERYGLGDDWLANLRWAYEGYVKLFKSDVEYEILETESEFTFPMPVDGAPELLITGRIDLETRHRETGKRQLWDHKSTTDRDLSKQAWSMETLMEDQFLLYAEAKRQAGEPVDAVIYNGARVKPLVKRELSDAERFARIRIPYNDRSLEVAWKDASNAATALVAFWNDPDSIYSVPNPRQCTWKCDFQKAHLDARSTGRSVTDVAISYGFRQKEGSLPVELDPAEPVW